MRTEQIVTALKVAESGSCLKVADALFLTPVSVSIRLNSLERELGFKLFKRKRGSLTPMVLTPQGERWLSFARKALDMLDEGRKGDGL